ncbi:lysophospholipid acyltransferase family protein [Candidatus Magnetominusculus dajiuhuensis]|uniref:lysophospholipid acyltransferase family protein n=1 Tax=Candidatus Magnetominusculus dajiuhuensis TaxID=3137712 RepID=UPI003B4333FC
MDKVKPPIGKLQVGAFLKWLYWRYLRVGFSLLPPWAINVMTAAMARVQMAIAGNRRQLMSEELRLSSLIKDRDAGQLMRKSFQNQLNAWIKQCYLRRMNDKTIDEYIPADGLSHLDSALVVGRGAILLNPHFGPYMMAMPALGHRGYRVNQLAIQAESPRVARVGLTMLANKARYDAVEGAMPVQFINAGAETFDNFGLRNMAIRDMLSALRRNELVLYPPTGRGGRKWHTAPFLGRTANFNLVPYKIALKEGVPLIPMFLIDSERAGSRAAARAVIEPPIEVSEGDTPEGLLMKYLAVLTSYVEKYPEHFAFFQFDMKIKSEWDDHPFFIR